MPHALIRRSIAAVAALIVFLGMLVIAPTATADATSRLWGGRSLRDCGLGISAVPCRLSDRLRRKRS